MAALATRRRATRIRSRAREHDDGDRDRSVRSSEHMRDAEGDGFDAEESDGDAEESDGDAVSDGEGEKKAARKITLPPADGSRAVDADDLGVSVISERNKAKRIAKGTWLVSFRTI